MKKWQTATHQLGQLPLPTATSLPRRAVTYVFPGNGSVTALLHAGQCLSCVPYVELRLSYVFSL